MGEGEIKKSLKSGLRYVNSQKKQAKKKGRKRNIRNSKKYNG